jgi:preprotein translocase subunit YajC
MKKALFGLLLASGSLFADDAAAPAREGNFFQTFALFGVAIVFFYFILWRPEQKRRKALEKQRSGLKKGDRATAMGIIGAVFRIQENTVILKMIDGAKIEVLKAAISDVQPGSEEEAKTVDLEPAESTQK